MTGNDLVCVRLRETLSDGAGNIVRDAKGALWDVRRYYRTYEDIIGRLRRGTLSDPLCKFIIGPWRPL